MYIMPDLGLFYIKFNMLLIYFIKGSMTSTIVIIQANNVSIHV